MPRLVMERTVLQARHAVHRLFDRPRDRDLHLVDGRDAVVDADHDAREIGGRENRDRNGERQIDADRDQREDDEDDGPGEARGPMLLRRLGRGASLAIILLSSLLRTVRGLVVARPDRRPRRRLLVLGVSR